MVYSGNNNTCSSSEWVNFKHEVYSESGGGGFETIVQPKHRQGESARRIKKGDPASVASWMNQPINSDSSWAPVVPPKNNLSAIESPISNKRRPPRQESRDNRKAGTKESSSSHRRQSSNATNPVSSSDSSTSSADRARKDRPKSLEKIAQDSPASRRGRSRTRNKTDAKNATPTTPTRSSSKSRGRSSSQKKTTVNEKERSTSVSRRKTTPNGSGDKNRDRSNSRPPPTSNNRTPRSNSRTTVTRSRSSSLTRPPPSTTRPPPSTTRTRREMQTRTPAPSSSNPSSSSVGPGVPPRRLHSSGDDNASLRSLDANIGRNISFGRTKPGRSSTPTSAAAKRSGFMEKLFGDSVTDEAKQAYLPRPEHSPTASVSSVVSWQQPEQIHSRILLTATVYNNTATNLWIATINTNQKGVAKNPSTASKYLKAFSFASEQEARESAIANAPPKMISFNESPNCFVCKGKFAMFRRAGHCRNCGVCVCNTCSTTWPSRMIPETYNLKKESQVKICKSCNFLSGAFKKALLDGDHEEAIALYGSGNVNLRTPFPQSAKKKDEIMHPIHCAVEGGNIDIVHWLMEDHFCPIKVIRTASGKKPKRGGCADTPILTSKGRSVLTIAMTHLNVDILRLLVIDCGVSIYEAQDLKGSLRVLEAVLLALPATKGGDRRNLLTIPRWDNASYDERSEASSLGADQTLDGGATLTSKDNTARRIADAVSFRG
jgi:hypothetical protein